MFAPFSTFIICLLPFIVSLFGSIKGQQPETCASFCVEGTEGWFSELRADPPDGTTVMLLWEHNTGVGGTQYVIQFRVANIADTASFNISAPIINDTTFTLTGLAPKATYDVRVCLTELPEECGNCILCVETDYDPVPPTRPLLMGSNISALVIELMWKRPVGQINSYTITYFPVDNSSAARNISVPSLDADMTWPVRNLLPNTTYQFTLVAVSDAYGSSLPSFPINVTTSLQSGSPGYLLISTNDDGNFYFFTTSDTVSGTRVNAEILELTPFSGISGIGYYPINSTNGFIYTSSSNGLITRHSATLLSDETTGGISITASSNVMNRSSSGVSLISVDWVNNMLYWLETVNDTYSIIMYSMLNGSEVNCVTPVSTAGGLKLNVTSIEVDPIHGYLYWSMLGTDGGIFRLDLALAKSGNCVNFATGVDSMVNETKIDSMTLNLEDDRLYFAFGSTNLASITLEEENIENYIHTGIGVDIRSIASYNEYLVVTSLSNLSVTFGLFVRIFGSQSSGGSVVGIRAENSAAQNATHLYMIREEFQPLPVPPEPVNEVKYFPTTTSINITWTPPQYTDMSFGPSAFSGWIYKLTFQSSSNVTADTEYQYSDLPPNTVYTVDILPSVPGAVGNVGDHTLTSWIVQTTENVVSIPNIILATNANGSVPIYTVMFNERQAVQLLEEGKPSFNQPSIGVAYDLYRNTIYWTNSDRVIVQSSLSSGDSISIREPDGSRTSIAVDYIGQRLYWIESNSIYRMLLESNSVTVMIVDIDISDLAVDSPSGLLFWTHNGGALRGISVMRLNGLGGRMICVSDSGQSYRYLAITVDTENKRIFWIKEVEGSFQIGVADYGSGSCINVVNKMISDKPNIQSTSDRRVSVVSMVYVAGVLLHTTLTSPNTIFITPSNFSSFPSTDYQLAIASYNISIAPGINIRSITANQTSQQFLPDNVGLNVTTITPSVPSNIRLDGSSNDTFINITWDMVEGVSPAIVSYEVTYSLSKIDGSTDTEPETILKISDNYFALENQLPETTINVSIRAYTRWYSSDMSPVKTLVSISRIPSQIEQSSASVFRGERRSSELSVLLSWTGLTAEQAGGILTSYIISLYSQPSRTLSSNFIVSPRSTSRLLAPSNILANQMYSFTVRAENRAGRGVESDEVMFNTNGPQPAMELLAVNSMGMTVIVRENSQPVPMEAFRGPFTVDNRQLIVYYVDSDNLMSISHNILNSAETIFTPLPMANDLALDWVGRRLYIAQIQNNIVSIRVLALDNIEMEELVNTSVPSNAMVKITLSPYIGQLYWIETTGTSLYRLNLLDNSVTQLYPSNSRKRNVMCSQSGLDTIGGLTAALTYDVITDHLWVSTVMGDIWSCDLSGCDCIVRVNGTTLLSPGGTLANIGLPTDSVSLDSVNIYWSGPAGVFYVPRNNVTLLSPLSSLNTSSIVTIDPGQQPLPVQMCLYPALTQAAQPVPFCNNVDALSNSLTVRWSEIQVTTQCVDQLYAFPTLSYNITYHMVGFPDEGGIIGNIFSRQTPVNGLLSFSYYNVTVSASNIYTRLAIDAAAVLNSVTCRTAQGAPSQVRDLTTSATSTTDILVTWRRPIASGTIEDTLSYSISINNNFLQLLNNTTTMHLITNLDPGTDYTIQVIANNSLGKSDPVQADGFTYPPPPVPVINGSSNITVRIQLTLLPNHRFLVIAVELRSAETETWRSQMLPSNTMYPSEPSLTLYSLLPATNYIVRTSAVYRNDQTIYSDESNFRTSDSFPGTPELTLDGVILQWDKPRENGQPITHFTLRVESRGEVQTLELNDMTNNIDLSMMNFTYDLSTTRLIIPGVLNKITLSAYNSIGDGNFSNSVNVTISEPSDEIPTGVLIGIIVGASVFAFIVLIIIIVLCYCYRLRPKNYDYAFRVEVPYDMELRKLRLNQMRMANNDLYSPNYNPDDVETLKKFPRDRIKLEKLLGRGAFGEVWAGTAVDIMGAGTGPHPVALKTLQKNATESDQRSFLSEAIVMSNFDHPNVLPVLGVCLNNNPFFLILELMEAGDLLAFLRGARQENGPPLLTVEELVKIALDVANGARYLETQHFVHRDLAARNCLVSSKGPDRVVKIGDFGLARDVYHSDYYRKEGQGLLPVRWMAPESLLDGKFTVDSDIWSYGILLWEITTLGRQPYPARSNQEVFQFVIGGGRCEKPDNCHPKLYRLMRQCWQHRPEERPRFTVLVDTLTRLHERLVEGNESSSSAEESEFEDEEPRYTIQQRGSGGRRSLRSSIRSGASNIVTGIVNLTRAGSMRMRHSIRRQGSLRRQDEINEARAASSINRGRCASSSEQQLLEPSSGLDHLVDDSAGEDQSRNSHTKEQNGFTEIGPF